MSEFTSVAPETRSEQCRDCGERFDQTLFMPGRWIPNVHPSCPKRIQPPRDERREQHSIRLLSTAQLQVPPLYRDVTLESYETITQSQRDVVARARKFCDEWDNRGDITSGFPHVVLMVGTPGTGKGHLAWGIAKFVAQSVPGDLVKVAKCSDIIRDLRESWRSSDAESESKRLRYYRGLELLVIDEVSRHALYGEPSRHLYDLIDNRQEWLRPTIVTSNETEAGIVELLGSALVSRASGWGGMWEFVGDDYRVKLRKRREM